MAGKTFWRGDKESQRIGDSVNYIEESTYVNGVLDGLVAQPGQTQRFNIFGNDSFRSQGKLFQKVQRCPQLLTNRRSSPICQDRFNEAIAKDLRRDRAVSARSEQALIFPRDKGRE